MTAATEVFRSNARHGFGNHIPRARLKAGTETVLSYIIRVPLDQTARARAIGAVEDDHIVSGFRFTEEQYAAWKHG
ncbi:hypothetical protein ACVXZ4_04170 [Lacisediminihabitans sp. FW035]